MTSTTDFIEALRVEIKQELRDEILSELKPDIERMLYANIFEIEEAARYMKTSPSTLRRMVKDREIEHFRIRNILHFRQIDLDKHIQMLLVKKE